MIQLVEPEAKRHSIHTSDKYAYDEMLHIIADIFNTTFRNS